MAKKPHPFGELNRTEDYHERMAARANVAFEEGKVSYLLGVFKMNVKKVGTQLRNREDEERGRPDLTFRAFNDTYQSFPMVLGATRLGGVQLHLEKSAMLPALFKEFGQAPFVSAYEAFYEQMGDKTGGRKLGLIFPRKGFKNGLVIYAADAITDLPLSDRESVLTYVGGSKKARHLLVVRSFQRVLEAIHAHGHGWRPDEG